MDQAFENVFKYCPICGQDSKETGKVPFVCPSCGFRHYFTPISAVGALIADSEDRLLFIERAKDPGMGLLGLPGGFVDADETAEQAVAREIKEEVGLTVTDLEFLITFPNQYHYNGIVTRVLDLFYVCRVKSFDDLQIEELEVRSYRFAIPSNEIYDQMAFDSNRRAVQKFAAIYLQSGD